MTTATKTLDHEPSNLSSIVLKTCHIPRPSGLQSTHLIKILTSKTKNEKHDFGGVKNEKNYND